jgi:hypothetical protein
VLWRDLDCAPHPGQKVGFRLSTVTVHARSRRSTPTTFKPTPGNHVIDVFIARCCRIPSQGATRPAHHRELHPASLAPRVNQTPAKWLPTLGEKLMSLDCANRGTAPREDSNSPFERWKATSMSAPAAKG